MDLATFVKKVMAYRALVRHVEWFVQTDEALTEGIPEIDDAGRQEHLNKVRAQLARVKLRFTYERDRLLQELVSDTIVFLKEEADTLGEVCECGRNAAPGIESTEPMCFECWMEKQYGYSLGFTGAEGEKDARHE